MRPAASEAHSDAEHGPGPCALAGRTEACALVAAHLVLITILLLLIAIQGCVTETKRRGTQSAPTRAVSVELRRTITGIGYQGVLFTPLDAEGNELFGWTPSDYDIARMEARLPRILAEAAPDLFAQGLPDLTRYQRQYSGYSDGGRKIIQVNFIHPTLIRERNLDWKQARVPVHDAGARYFQVWFDVDAAIIVQVLPSS